jgi:CRP-like cAMP-binding protein
MVGKRADDLSGAASSWAVKAALQPDAFIARLRGSGSLRPADEARLRAACRQARRYPAGHDLIREGDDPGPVFVIIDGWVARYKLLQDGTRQIIAFMMPGDFCDMHVAELNMMDHNIGTLTAATVATIQPSMMRELVESSPELTRAFWLTQLVEAAILRSTIVSLGRRKSVQRVAHLLCELCFRLWNAYPTKNGQFVLPFSQIVLADAVGLTPIHVNRVIRALRLSGALEVDGGAITISDIKVLAGIANYDDIYLHMRLKA